MASPSLTTGGGEAVGIDALKRVRDGTRRLHRQLDRESSLARLASPDCSLTEYRTALSPLARAYAQVDGMLIAGEAYRPVGLAPYQARSPLIGAALSASNAQPGYLEPATEPRAIDSVAAYLGCRYVVEGAQFGHALIGQMLARSEVAQRLPGAALSFWRARFLAPGEWGALCHRLEHMATRAEAAIATVSARRIFELFKCCFAEAASEVGR